VELLDRGFLLARRSSLDNTVRSLFAASAPAAVILGIYFLERVEGVRGLRFLFAVALVLSLWCRALLLAPVTRAHALALWPGMPLAPGAGRPVDIVRTASVAALELWLWMWPLIGLAKLSSFATLALLPFLAARAALAPSWLARAACHPGGGFRGYAGAVGDASGARGVSVLAELMFLLGAAVLFGNLYAVLALSLYLGRSLLGLDTAFVSSFISPSNNMVLLAMVSLTLVLMEPLRAALSALSLVDARSRREGMDLHAAIDHAIDRSRPREE
jgi:hypothetical protein